MIFKNLETVQRTVFRLEAILETDKSLDYYDKQYLTQSIVTLKAICERHAVSKELGVEFDEDDLRV